MQRDNDFANEEHAGNQSEADPVLDDGCDSKAKQDAHQSIIDVAKKEDGELLPEGSGLDGEDDMDINAGIQDITEAQLEHTSATSMPSPAHIDDDPYVNDTNSAEISNANEQNEEGEVAEDVAEGSDKSTDGQDQIVGDVDNSESNPSASVDSTISREDVPRMVPGLDEIRPPHATRSSTTIYLTERVKERQAARLGRSTAPAPAPLTRRGRVTLTRSRGGRRQTSGDQG